MLLRIFLKTIGVVLSLVDTSVFGGIALILLGGLICYCGHRKKAPKAAGSAKEKVTLH